MVIDQNSKAKMVNNTVTTTRTTPMTQAAASCKLSNHKPHPTPHPLVLPPSYPKQKLSNADSTPNTTNANPLISTFTLIKRPKLPTN